MMIKYELAETGFIPLCDLLKTTGLCESGGHAKVVIQNQEVKVDGVIETRKRCKVRYGQSIEFQNNIIEVIKKDDS